MGRGYSCGEWSHPGPKIRTWGTQFCHSSMTPWTWATRRVRFEVSQVRESRPIRQAQGRLWGTQFCHRNSPAALCEDPLIAIVPR